VCLQKESILFGLLRVFQAHLELSNGSGLAGGVWCASGPAGGLCPSGSAGLWPVCWQAGSHAFLF
jgi:hypothetical protein